MTDIEKLDKCISSLNIISRMLDDIRYECSATEYTLDENEMGWVFAARDIAQHTLMKVRND